MNKSIIQKCQQCNNEFKAYISNIKRGGNKFCSLSCKAKQYHLENPNYIHGTSEERFLKNIKISKDKNACWIWIGTIQTCGYGAIYINQKNTKAHRYSYEYFKGKIPKGKIIMHRCDVKICVNPKHLMIGTHLENAQDRNNKGRNNSCIGSSHGGAKLTEKDIKDIRKRHENGETQISIAKDYGIKQVTVSDINRRKIWKHVL